MLTMSCEDVRRNLSAYHDEALTIGQRIAIGDHLEHCEGCSVDAGDLVAMREALRAAHYREQVACGPILARLQSDITERLAAEERVSFATWLHELVEDRRRALAISGSALAACVLVVFGMCQLGLGTVDHPDSLAKMMAHEEQVWAARAETPVSLPRVNPESVMPAAYMNQGDGDESLSAFSALVRSDGQLAELEFLGGHTVSLTGRTTRTQMESDLLAAASTASFQPARQAAGEAVPLNVVWVVTHRTVRATTRARIDVSSTFRLGVGISSLGSPTLAPKTV
jgi:Putative zinc-finger